MTNREKYFLKRDEYDTMMAIAENIRDVGVYCAIRAVTGKRRPCLIRYVDVDIEYRDCEQCIQDFLNEDAEL